MKRSVKKIVEAAKALTVLLNLVKAAVELINLL
jgi:hypothetical protein